MKISVLIPAYNAAATIRESVQSALRQTVSPEEVLVLDDGSSDDTAAIVEEMQDHRLIVLREPRNGVGKARDILCQRARGELLAFLDADDIWHPKYLETQAALFKLYPQAGINFTGHIDFHGLGDYSWKDLPGDPIVHGELIPPLLFFTRYNRATAPFASMTYCCVKRDILREIGDRPFSGNGGLPIGEDSYFFYLVALTGRPVAFTPARLAAYRIVQHSASSNRLKACSAIVQIFELLEPRYREKADSKLYKAFWDAFAAKRREYAKILLGRGGISEARAQLRSSLGQYTGLTSVAKSSALLFLSYMPSRLQPTWPSGNRQS